MFLLVIIMLWSLLFLLLFCYCNIDERLWPWKSSNDVKEGMEGCLFSFTYYYFKRNLDTCCSVTVMVFAVFVVVVIIIVKPNVNDFSGFLI